MSIKMSCACWNESISEPIRLHDCTMIRLHDCIVDQKWTCSRLSLLNAQYLTLTSFAYCSKSVSESTLEEFFSSGGIKYEILGTPIKSFMSPTRRPMPWYAKPSSLGKMGMSILWRISVRGEASPFEMVFQTS